MMRKERLDALKQVKLAPGTTFISTQWHSDLDLADLLALHTSPDVHSAPRGPSSSIFRECLYSAISRDCASGKQETH